MKNLDRNQIISGAQRYVSMAKERWARASVRQRKIVGGILAVLLVVIGINVLTDDAADSRTSLSGGASTGQGASAMTPGEIARWAEDVEDEYLAQYGYTEFMEAETAPGTVPSAINTFDATDQGELKVYIWAWISEDDAQVVADDVAATLAGSPDAPETVVVSVAWDKPTLARASVRG
ncbi:hypothetical protein AS188_03835 [Kocuria flava]|uniref:Uncharacterized protein n=1 Tax=Kocuria flava TaxID=446860 RepID=A0A0U3G7A5_9MICC|nr:hypothetical protein [Kocuria flava]ALU39019.1 hypothetical protein AS188_03835 [Kocuria flava]GEO91406.1 hypothetical protein KFL01_07120 [Kocuria flava]